MPALPAVERIQQVRPLNRPRAIHHYLRSSSTSTSTSSSSYTTMRTSATKRKSYTSTIPSSPSPSPIIHSSNTDNIMNHTPTKQQTQQTQVNLRSTRTSSVTSTASSQHQHQSSHEDANASTSSRSLLLPLPSPSRHLIDEEGGLSSLLDTKWDIALLAVAIFFAFNLVVVICCFWQRRRRQGRAIHVDDQEDARTGPAQKGKPEQLANQQLPPSKRTKKRGGAGAGAGGVARDGTGSGAAPKASKAHVNKYPIVPVISFAARSHLETSSSDDGQGGGDDARSIVSSMYDTTSQKWDESYFNTSHHDGNGNGRSTGANGTYNGVMKETIDGILGSRFFPYNAPTTPILPTSPSSSPRKRDLQDDGGRKISGTSGDTSTTQAESNTGLSFPASTHSFEI